MKQPMEFYIRTLAHEKIWNKTMGIMHDSWMEKANDASWYCIKDNAQLVADQVRDQLKEHVTGQVQEPL